MSNILTPVSLWKDFDSSLELDAEVISRKTEGNITIEYVRFGGRKTGSGRVKICAAFAGSSAQYSGEAVMLLPD